MVDLGNDGGECHICGSADGNVERWAIRPAQRGRSRFVELHDHCGGALLGRLYNAASPGKHGRDRMLGDEQVDANAPRPAPPPDWQARVADG